ncbi:hypothetical protein PIB30_053053 [Stylosanthes scabra]|uniref:Uncharacterized protein n=1 Tax=Stylosanthes scabra TaxID=79078 RepID=A0ABU6VIK3_9FABA|nr:hypothetical protein [Stylosanthes scabra]
MGAVGSERWKINPAAVDHAAMACHDWTVHKVSCSHPLDFTPAKFLKLPLWCVVCLSYPDRLLARRTIGFTWLPEYKLLIPKPTANHAAVGFSEHDEYIPMVDKTVDVG